MKIVVVHWITTASGFHSSTDGYSLHIDNLEALTYKNKREDNNKPIEYQSMYEFKAFDNGKEFILRDEEFIKRLKNEKTIFIPFYQMRKFFNKLENAE
jgi:hypothetical protein